MKRDIAWYSFGDGRAILFVHGWCMSSAVWGGQLTALAAKYRTVALDLRGHGQSGVPDDGLLGFNGFAADLTGLVEQLDLEKLILVGWSLGGQVVLKALKQISHRVSGVVLVGATPRFTASEGFPYGLAPAEAEGMRLKLRRNTERALTGFQSRMFSESELADAECMKRCSSLLDEVVMPAQGAAIDGLEALMLDDMTADAAEVASPTLVIHGSYDRICLPGASAWLEQSIKGSTRICYQGAGHALFMTEPERFNKDLLDFAEGLDV